MPTLKILQLKTKPLWIVEQQQSSVHGPVNPAGRNHAPLFIDESMEESIDAVVEAEG
jgi:hypothetical protein